MHERVMDVLIEKGGDFAHGFTYSGHPASCAVEIENIKIIEDEKLVEKVANETGPYLKKRWQEFENHPIVGEVRNVGLLGAIELVENKEKRQFFPSAKKSWRCMQNFLF